MSKYFPKCRHNFSDAFNECVYCGSELKNGTIEIEDIQTEKPIYEMTDEEILDKYSDYKKRIEEQTGRKMSDSEFLLGIREARRDSSNYRADRCKNISESIANVPKCSTCQNTHIKKSLDYQKRVVLLCGEYFRGKFINSGVVTIVEVNGRGRLLWL